MENNISNVQDIRTSFHKEAFKEICSKLFFPTQSIFNNKNFITIGDSISWQDKKLYPYPNSKKAIGYQSILQDNLGFGRYENISESGKAIADGTSNGYGINTIVKNMETYENFDLIILSGGTNDFKLNVPLGEITSQRFDTETVTGAYQSLLEYILQTSSKEKIVLLTPLERNKDGFNSWETKNSNGLMLKDYRNRILKIAELYDISVIDLFYKSGITKDNLNDLTYDGLHPNDKGYKKIAEKLTDFILSKYGEDSKNNEKY